MIGRALQMVMAAAFAMTVAHALQPEVKQAVDALNKISEALSHGQP